MANNASAKKRIRQTETATLRNRAVKSRLRTFRKQLLAAIEDGDAEKSTKAYNQYASAADRAAKNNVIHKNAASRMKARMAARLNPKSA
ncbi:MAG: 30S ribosomal protein S20 [Verrucomicrobiales bacterium]|nr:30S ribosomal protein S20 [Verrucomicrobiales bacterium]